MLTYEGKCTINGNKYLIVKSKLHCSGYIYNADNPDMPFSEHWQCGKTQDDKSGHHYYYETHYVPERQVKRRNSFDICDKKGEFTGTITPAATGFPDIHKRIKGI